MSRCCFAPGCKAGYRTGPKGVSCFRVPKDEKLFEKWKRSIPPRPDGKQLHSKAVVCSRHFDERFIVKYYEYIINNEVVRLERGNRKLSADAYPTIFPDSPKYYTKRLPKKRTPISRQPLPPPKKKPPTERTSVTSDNDANVPYEDEPDEPLEGGGGGDATPAASNLSPPSFKAYSPRESKKSKGSIEQKRPETREAETQTVPEPPEVIEVTPIFPYEDLPLPSKQWAKHVIQEKPRTISYSVCSLTEAGALKTDKLIVVADKELYAECRVYIDGVRIPVLETTVKKDEDHAATVLERMHNVRKCHGFADLSEFPFASASKTIKIENDRLYHTRCHIIVTTRGQTCALCLRGRHLMKSKIGRMKQKDETGDERIETILLNQGNQPSDLVGDAVPMAAAEYTTQSFNGIGLTDIQLVHDVEELMPNDTYQYVQDNVPQPHYDIIEDATNTFSDEPVTVEIPYETPVTGPNSVYVA